MILVTRSVALSNTQYSLLLEKEGIFIHLQSEWIGSLVKYGARRPQCFSTLFDKGKDGDYTDSIGINNDECEYFINGIINNDRLFIQGMVFDFTFEIDYLLGTGAQEKITCLNT